MPRAIVALGGNTLLRSGEGTIAEQRERMRETREALHPLREHDYDVVFTHGNGPQVGNRLLEEEESSGPTEPLDVIGAETQAQVGYLLQGAFGDAFGPDPAVVVTRTRVDPDDPAFENPTKPIGSYYTEAEAADQPVETTEVHRDGEAAYRRVVPSPKPASVLEIDRIRTLARDDAGPVICGGGGGVPGVPAGESDGSVAPAETESDGLEAPDEGSRFEGVAAVIDKDHTSRLVAEAVDADEFAAGSMQPKVEACVDFVEAVGGRAIITSPDRLADALQGEAGDACRARGVSRSAAAHLSVSDGCGRL